MNPQDIAPMILGLAMMATIGGVILFCPLTKRLGDLLELMIKERRTQPLPDSRLKETLERMDERLHMLEERQDFTDALIAQPARSRSLSPAQEAFTTEPRERS
jgi:hypothetical protein